MQRSKDSSIVFSLVYRGDNPATTLRDMPYPWRKALCERTQLSNSVFLGEMLAIICKSGGLSHELSLTHHCTTALCASALHSGTPLAQISPGPLAERLVSN